MIAIDNNVLGYHLLQDGTAEQRRAALDLLSQPGPYWVPVTVVLEFAWLLMSKKKARSEIVSVLRGMAAIPNLKLQHDDAVRQAIEHCQQGLDFADALNLALCGNATELVTFDKPFADRAGVLATVPLVRLLSRAAR